MYQTQFTSKKHSPRLKLKIPFYSVLAGVVVLLLFLLVWGVLNKQERNYLNSLSFSTDELTLQNKQMLGSGTSSHLVNLSLDVQAIPKLINFKNVDSSLSKLLLITGLSLSFFVALVVFLVLNVIIRTRIIKDTSEHLDVLFKSIQGISYCCTASYPWSMTFVSEGCKNICGYEQEDLESHKVHWGKLTHPDDRQYIQKLVNEAIEGNKSFEFEYRIRTRSGIEKWMWEQGEVIRTSDNNIMLEGFITDISNQKRSESKFMEAQNFSEAIVNTAIEAIIIMGADNRIRSFNRAAQTTFGYSMEEAIGQNLEILFLKKYHQKHNKYIKYFRETGKLKYLFERREMQLLHKDGSDFPAYVSVNELKYQENTQFFCLIKDISIERLAQQEAQEQREQLAHVDRLNLLGEMSSGIAHEINQPLTAISLLSKSGKQLIDKNQFDRLPEIFDQLSKHALRASTIIERMQNMAMHHDNIREQVDCNIIINEIVNFAEIDARIRDITIDKDFGFNLPQIRVDKVQIQQVALNLLLNGMEAMALAPKQNISAKKIVIRTRKYQNDQIEIAVIDSGLGISNEVEKILFEPFSTNKKSGMGMGLSISKAIVVAHGGQLNYYNNKSGGATFFFTVPHAGIGA